MNRRQLIVQPLTGFDSEIGRAVWMLENTRQRTMPHLIGLDPGAVDWRPGWALHSIGTLLYHIAAVEADWLYTDILQQPFAAEIESLFPYNALNEDGKLTVVAGESLDHLLQRLAAVRRVLLDNFRVMTIEEFRRPRALPQHDVTPEWVLHHLCQHEAEHRAEIAALRTQFLLQ